MSDCGELDELIELLAPPSTNPIVPAHINWTNMTETLAYIDSSAELVHARPQYINLMTFRDKILQDITDTKKQRQLCATVFHFIQKLKTIIHVDTSFNEVYSRIVLLRNSFLGQQDSHGNNIPTCTE